MPEERTNEDVDGHHRRTYILTRDLGQKVSQIKSLGLKTLSADDAIFDEIHQGLVDRIGACFPNDDLRVVATEDLAKEIVTNALKLKPELSELLLVSTCQDICVEGHGYQIDLNRLVNSSGKIIGIGERPGCRSIDEQINALKSVFYHKDIVIVEDGVFTGSTLKYLLSKLRHKVRAIIIGIVFKDGLKSLRQVYDGEVIAIEEMKDFIDWMPDHDFFPFVPNCGRVIGIPCACENEAVPKLLEDVHLSGSSLCIPYVLPFAPMKDWASIPEHATLDISRYCLEATREIFERINKLNDTDLTYRDLINCRPRISIPIEVGTNVCGEFENRSVIDQLEKYIAELG